MALIWVGKPQPSIQLKMNADFYLIVPKVAIYNVLKFMGWWTKSSPNLYTSRIPIPRLSFLALTFDRVFELQRMGALTAAIYM